MAAGNDLPIYRCPRIDRELAVTGKLDDPFWDRAPVVRLVEAASGAAPRQPTEVRILRGPARLYIGFRCADTHVWGTKTARDADIFNEECVEVFISPAGTAHQYYEINVSPKNVVFDACVLNRRIRPGMRAPYQGIPAFDVKGLETAIHIDGELDRPGGATAWSAEYAIPFDSIIGAPNVPPQAGYRWRLNLYRIDAPEGAKREFSAWSPTRVIDFHLPEAFGTLEFE